MLIFVLLMTDITNLLLCSLVTRIKSLILSLILEIGILACKNKYVNLTVELQHKFALSALHYYAIKCCLIIAFIPLNTLVLVRIWFCFGKDEVTLSSGFLR